MRCCWCLLILRPRQKCDIGLGHLASKLFFSSSQKEYWHLFYWDTADFLLQSVTGERSAKQLPADCSATDRRLSANTLGFD